MTSSSGPLVQLNSNSFLMHATVLTHTLNSNKQYLQPPFPFLTYKWSLITARLKPISTPNPRTPTSTWIGLAVIRATPRLSSHTAWHSGYAASARRINVSKNEHGNFLTSYLTGVTSPNTSNSPSQGQDKQLGERRYVLIPTWIIPRGFH